VKFFTSKFKIKVVLLASTDKTGRID